jgi:hypothetical protein
LHQGAAAAAVLEAVGITHVTVPLLRTHFDSVVEIIKGDNEDGGGGGGSGSGNSGGSGGGARLSSSQHPSQGSQGGDRELDGKCVALLRQLLGVLECFFSYVTRFNLHLGRLANANSL